MAEYQNLTKEEFGILKSVPITAGAMVVTLDKAGVVEATREMLASSRVVAEATARFPDNVLIAKLHAELHDPEQYRNQAKREKAESNRVKISDSSVAMEAFVGLLDQALNILDAKIDPTEALGYRQWVLACATAGAEAAKEGGVLGFGGKRISDAEAAYLAHLQKRLGL